MAISPVLVPLTDDPESDELEIEIEGDEDGIDIEIDLDPSDNLAEDLDEEELTKIASDVIEDFMNDRDSREDWAKAYVKSLDLLGLKIEDRTQPWQGASGVFHPIMMETVIRFQAQAMGELFPASGPARVKIMEESSRELLEQSRRVEKELNYQLTENMVDYREETETQLFHLGCAGSAFKKIFYDPMDERPSAMFVPAEDIVVPYAATSLEKCERISHCMKKSQGEVEALMDEGFYRDIDLGDPEYQRSDIQEKYDEISGEEPSYTDDQRYTLIEQHAYLSIGDSEESLPYIITVEMGSKKVLSIRENWKKSDPKKRRLNHFVHYKYLPGMGFYGIGLCHLLGGLTKTATATIRQLLDAGTLANLPAGLKTRGLRIKGDNTPFRPGEFRDVDVPGNAIRDNITFLPYKEPSATLFSLFQTVIEEARRMGNISEMEIANANKETPVGTTFALMERQLKVMTGVQARMHAALRKELKIIARIIHEDMPPEYDWTDKGNRKEDFDGRVDILPVSDPNAATTAQRVVSFQTAMQMAQQAPNLYNMGKLHRKMLDTLGIDDANEILKLPDDVEPMDPVTENMAMMKQEPVKAFQYQDHEAHIAVHTAAAEDPKIQQIVGQSPFAAAISSALASHITEHVAMQYRQEIEARMGVPMPGEDDKLPQDVERELASVMASAANKLLEANKAEVAQQEAEAQANDPLTQIQQRELALKEKEFEHKSQMDIMKLQLEGWSKGGNMAHQRERLNSEEMRAAMNAAITIATEPDKESKTMLEAMRIAKEYAQRFEAEAQQDEQRAQQMANMNNRGGGNAGQ